MSKRLTSLNQMEKAFRQAYRLISKSQNILLIFHECPDGDAIASSLAMYIFLTGLEKRTDLAVKDEIPKYFNFLVASYSIKRDFLLGDYDLVIAVDCGDSRRTGFPARIEAIAKVKPLINIDHHSSNNLKKYAGVNLVDENAAATAEVVYRFLKYLKVKIDSRIATYILAAIYYDTGGFYHSNVTSSTLNIASECLRHGARFGLIADNAVNVRSSSGLKLWGSALVNMRIKNNIAFSYLDHQVVLANGAKPDDAAGVVNLINSLPEAKVAILFIDTPDGKIKASLRTEESDIDVSKLARLFGGGGHRRAAGFTLEKKDFLDIVGH